MSGRGGTPLCPECGAAEIVTEAWREEKVELALTEITEGGAWHFYEMGPVDNNAPDYDTDTDRSLRVYCYACGHDMEWEEWDIRPPDGAVPNDEDP